MTDNIEFSIDEYKKCINDKSYFIENYVMVPHSGTYKKLVLDDWHKGVLENKGFHFMDLSAGKTTLGLAYLLWDIVFSHDRTFVICDMHMDSTMSSKDKLLMMWSMLPKALRTDIKNNNKRSITFGNRNEIIFSNQNRLVEDCRGKGIYFVFLDNYLLYDKQNLQNIKDHILAFVHNYLGLSSFA